MNDKENQPKSIKTIFLGDQPKDFRVHQVQTCLEALKTLFCGYCAY